MTRYGSTVLVVAALGLAAWSGACSESPCVSCPPPLPASGFIASDPVPNLSTTVSSTAGIARSLSAGDGAVYVTLLPGTVPSGRNAEIHVVGGVDTVFTSVSAGGFDPVPVLAGAGDSIEVAVSDGGSAVLQRSGLWCRPDGRRGGLLLGTQWVRRARQRLHDRQQRAGEGCGTAVDPSWFLCVLLSNRLQAVRLTRSSPTRDRCSVLSSMTEPMTRRHPSSAGHG